MEVIIREYNNYDRDKICSLLERNTNYQRDQQFWIWINKCIGFMSPIIVIAEIDSKVVGHYAIIPHPIVVAGEIENAGLGIHALIDSEYRSKVSIFDITSLAYKIAQERGLKFIYGFPNENYRFIQEKIERWKKVALFKSIDFSTKDEALAIENSDYKLSKCTNSYKDLFLLDELVTNQIKDSKNYIFKNLIYYKTRYLEHPQNIYRCFFVYKKDSLSGFVVFKEFLEYPSSKGHLIDFIKTPSLSEEELVSVTFGYFRNKVDVISFWPNNSSFRQTLTGIANAKEGFNTYFGIKILDIEFGKTHNNLLDIDSWELVMGDSDAF